MRPVFLRNHSTIIALVFVLLLLAALSLMLVVFSGKAQAAGPDMRFDKQTCHAWEGGLGAQGSYSACPPTVVRIDVPGPVQVQVVEKVVPGVTPPPLVIQAECSAPPPVKAPPKKLNRPKPKIDCK